MRKLTLVLFLLASGGSAHADNLMDCQRYTANVVYLVLAGAPYDVVRDEIFEFEGKYQPYQSKELVDQTTREVYLELGKNRITGGNPHVGILRDLQQSRCSVRMLYRYWE